METAKGVAGAAIVIICSLSRRRSAEQRRSFPALLRAGIVSLALILAAFLPEFVRNAEHFGYGFIGIMLGVPFLRVFRYALAFDLLMNMAVASKSLGAKRAVGVDLVAILGLLVIAVPVSYELGLSYARTFVLDL